MLEQEDFIEMRHVGYNSIFLLLGLTISAPMIGIFFVATSSVNDFSYSSVLFGNLPTLTTYSLNTFLLCVGTATVTVVYSIPAAWLLSAYEFKGKKVIEVFLILPMTMPAYILAYAYTDALDFSGWLSESLIQFFLFLSVFGSYEDARNSWPEIRSLYFACLLLGISLSPYVILVSRRAFQGNHVLLIEAARTMGVDSLTIFFKIVLPLARPAIIGALLLITMECLADFGTVSYFSIQTLSTGLYKAWLGYGDMSMTSLIAVFIFIVAIFIVFLDRLMKPKLYKVSSSKTKFRPIEARGKKRFFMLLFLSMSGVFGFFLPSMFLMKTSFETFLFMGYSGDYITSIISSVSKTLFLAITATILVLSVSLILIHILRQKNSKLPDILAQVLASNYAVAGLVSALSLLTLFGFFREVFFEGIRYHQNITYFLSLSLLFLAYLSRYFAVGHGVLDSSLKSISRNVDFSAGSLGLPPLTAFVRLHLPLLKSSIIIAGILVFLDILKELPATLILRPLDFETLAINAYSYASDERLGLAAIPSFAMVVISLPVVLFLQKKLREVNY